MLSPSGRHKWYHLHCVYKNVLYLDVGWPSTHTSNLQCNTDHTNISKDKEFIRNHKDLAVRGVMHVYEKNPTYHTQI